MTIRNISYLDPTSVYHFIFVLWPSSNFIKIHSTQHQDIGTTRQTLTVPVYILVQNKQYDLFIKTIFQSHDSSNDIVNRDKLNMILQCDMMDAAVWWDCFQWTLKQLYLGWSIFSCVSVTSQSLTYNHYFILTRSQRWHVAIKYLFQYVPCYAIPPPHLPNDFMIPKLWRGVFVLFEGTALIRAGGTDHDVIISCWLI